MTTKEDLFRDYDEMMSGQPPPHRNGHHHTHDADADSDHAALPVASFEEIDQRRYEPARFLVESILPAGEATLVSALERSLKSYLVMEWALSIALGRAFLDRYPARRGTVLLIDLENRIDRLRDRVRASLRRDGLEPSDLEGRLLLFDRQKDAPRWQLDADTLHATRRTIVAHTPALVIVDNFRKATPAGKDEKDTRDVLPLLNSLLAICEAQDAALVLVHHNRKDDGSYSGSGAIASTVANTVLVQRDRATGIATVRAETMRNSENFMPFGIVMGEDGALRHVTVAASAPAASKPDRGGDVLGCLARGAKTIEEISQDTGISPYLTREEIKRLIDSGAVVKAGKRQGDKGTPSTLYGLPAHVAN